MYLKKHPVQVNQIGKLSKLLDYENKRLFYRRDLHIFYLF